jgi:predicted amidohydrolase
MRHVAKEGRCFVIGCCQAFRKDDIPDHLFFKAKYLSDLEGWINPGDSVIVDPDGKVVAGPARECESIFYADITRDQLIGPGGNSTLPATTHGPTCSSCSSIERPGL